MALGAGLLLLGCATQQPAVFPTAAKLPDDERRPDAVAIDLHSDPPPSRDHASAADEIVTLRTPLGMDAAYDVVQAFFDAVVHESSAEMSALLKSDTVVEDTRASRSGGRRNRSAISWWRDRFHKYPYEKMAKRLLYRASEVETYRGAHLDALPPELVQGSDATGHYSFQESDLVLRVPIITHSIANERMLGTEMYFWLRRDGSRYVVYHMAEQFPF